MFLATDDPAKAGPQTRTCCVSDHDPEPTKQALTCPQCGMKLTPLKVGGDTGGSGGDTGADGKKREIKYWVAPMDPSYVRDGPGKSPMGMDLVPVYADEISGGPTVRIDPVTEQDMGLRYDTVRLGPLDKTIRTVGTVETAAVFTW